MGDAEFTFDFPWIYGRRSRPRATRAWLSVVAVWCAVVALWGATMASPGQALATLAGVLGVLAAIDGHLRRVQVVRWGLDVSRGALRIDYGAPLFSTPRTATCSRETFRRVRVRAVRGSARVLELEFAPPDAKRGSVAPLVQGLSADGPALLRIARQIEGVLGRAEAGEDGSSPTGA